MYSLQDQRARIEARREKIRRWQQPIRHPLRNALIGMVAVAVLFAAGIALLHSAAVSHKQLLVPSRRDEDLRGFPRTSLGLVSQEQSFYGH